MTDTVPAALKAIKPFMKRASEVERSDKLQAQVVAYYCRAYAMDKAFKLNVRQQPGVDEFLFALMDKLEAEKKTLGATKAESKDIVKNFSLGVFKKADDEYRAGVADKGTARSFYAAGSFLEVNKVFDSESKEEKELDNLRKYAKMKATEIMLAVKQGKQALPPDFVEPKQQVQAEEESDESDDEPQMPNIVKEERKKKRRQTRLEPRGAGGTEETKKAEAYAREAVRSLQKDKIQDGANSISEALSILEMKKPDAKVDKDLTPEEKADALEYVMFAVRSLECCGETVDIDDGIDLAVNHFSEALRILSG